MIEVEKALELIAENTKSLGSEEIPVDNSYGFVLSKDVYAEMSMPPFPQSAMDGYAFRHSDLTRHKGKLTLLGESKTGDISQKGLKSGTCMRIFTGAVVPEGADSVVMQEMVEKDGESITITNFDRISLGSNVRPTGEEIEKGGKALQKGDRINSAAIGFLISIGIKTVEVYRKPKIGIIITGDELKEFGAKLERGQIYESNSLVLRSALQQFGIEKVSVVKVKDDLKNTETELYNLLNANDIVISCGGISVGDYDFVPSAAKNLNIQQVFYKVNQKPGKPLFFGKWKDKSFYALPGNPGSMLTCFYIYILTALNLMCGITIQNRFIDLPLGTDLSLRGERAHFIQAFISGNKVFPLEGQSSFMLKSFAKATALIYCEPGKENLPKNSMVKVVLLPTP